GQWGSRRVWRQSGPTMIGGRLSAISESQIGAFGRAALAEVLTAVTPGRRRGARGRPRELDFEQNYGHEGGQASRQPHDSWRYSTTADLFSRAAMARKARPRSRLPRPIFLALSLRQRRSAQHSSPLRRAAPSIHRICRPSTELRAAPRG